jgi:hypothetical protein
MFLTRVYLPAAPLAKKLKHLKHAIAKSQADTLVVMPPVKYGVILLLFIFIYYTYFILVDVTCFK